MDQVRGALVQLGDTQKPWRWAKLPSRSGWMCWEAPV
jgi:hypothetical protein